MRPKSKTYVITATDADGIAQSQTPTGAGALTLNGILISGGILTLSVGQHVSVTCAGSDAARTFTFTGTDNFGNALTESLAGSAASVTNGTKNFKTVTSVTVDAATAGAVTIGVLGVLETPWIPLDHYQTPFSVTFHVDIGTATFSVQGTLDDVQDNTITPSAYTVQASGTSDVVGAITSPTKAVRLSITAFTTGDIVFKVMQAGI